MSDEPKNKTNKEEQEFQARFKSLPEDLQRAFTSSEITENIVNVGKKHGLTIDKIGELGDETGLVMLGITSPKDYINNLASRLGMEKAQAKLVAEDINQKVFQPIRESLKKIHGIGMDTTIGGAEAVAITRGKTSDVGISKTSDVEERVAKTMSTAPSSTTQALLPTLGVGSQKTPSVLQSATGPKTFGTQFNPLLAKKLEPLSPLKPSSVPPPNLPIEPLTPSTPLEAGRPVAPAVRPQASGPLTGQAPPPNLPINPINLAASDAVENLNQKDVKAEIEKVLEAEIKVSPPTSNDKIKNNYSGKDPYREPLI